MESVWATLAGGGRAVSATFEDAGRLLGSAAGEAGREVARSSRQAGNSLQRHLATLPAALVGEPRVPQPYAWGPWGPGHFLKDLGLVSSECLPAARGGPRRAGSRAH